MLSSLFGSTSQAAQHLTQLAWQWRRRPRDSRAREPVCLVSWPQQPQQPSSRAAQLRAQPRPRVETAFLSLCGYWPFAQRGSSSSKSTSAASCWQQIQHPDSGSAQITSGAFSRRCLTLPCSHLQASQPAGAKAPPRLPKSRYGTPPPHRVPLPRSMHGTTEPTSTPRQCLSPRNALPSRRGRAHFPCGRLSPAVQLRQMITPPQAVPARTHVVARRRARASQFAHRARAVAAAPNAPPACDGGGGLMKGGAVKGSLGSRLPRSPPRAGGWGGGRCAAEMAQMRGWLVAAARPRTLRAGYQWPQRVRDAAARRIAGPLSSRPCTRVCVSTNALPARLRDSSRARPVYWCGDVEAAAGL